MYKILITLLIALSPLFTQAQQWINCTSGNHVNDIVAHDDVLWIATDGGLVKYNRANEEKSFFNRSNANIPTDNISSLVLDNEHRIWIGAASSYYCNEGIAYYDGEEWTNLDSICGVLGKANNGDALVLSSRKLYQFNGDDFTFIDLPENVCTVPTGIAVSPVNGDIWMTFYDFGCYSIVKYDGESFEVFANENSPIPFGEPSNNSIYVDESGKVWLGSWSSIYVYDGNEWLLYNAENSNLPNGIVNSIIEDDEGLIWVGIENYYLSDSTLIGLASFDGENWETYELPTAYKYANIVNVVLPMENEILIGTEDGLFSYDLTSFEKIPTSNTDLVENTVRSILHHDGDTWMSVGANSIFEYKNAVRINGEDWTSFDATNGPFVEGNGVKVMDVDDEGRVYVQSGNEIYFYDGVNWQLFEVPDLVDDIVESQAEIRFDKDNLPWLFNYSGYIFRYTGTDWVIIEPVEHGNYSGIYLGLAFDKNTNDLWMGSYGGLFHFDGNTWTQYTNFGLSSNPNVHAVKIADDGNVWFTATNGVAKFDGNTFTAYYTTQAIGLTINHSFRSIEIDADGHIWAGAYNTLVEFDGENWEIYTTQNSGLPNGEIYALAEDEYENMWIGTTQAGFAIFNKNGIEGQGEHTLTKEIATTLPLYVYPNLITGQNSFHIDLPNDNMAKFAKLVLTDTFGKQLFESNISLSQQHYKLDLTHLQLSSATYFISLITNEKKYVAKVVVLREK